ncbi:subunit IV of cytochrome c oxidase [Ophiocordyceps camponoti-floridani]|uniref:Subunit IV of cytochrome c oxidase n=1 Tax=Ophiocordyceps camponoti-floridani TaxID=2030778 RepID=A0A8H4Q952_9HYPO|nr:subunit IV of cytochrome c oxidase [Ophiocordyceps camponoti-floridani]
MPGPMRGVPVDVITEASPYWNPEWASLDEFLSKEDDEAKAKVHYHELAHIQPSNKDIRDRGKRHQDNMSKYHKIREIFGPGSLYHPNQVLAKFHFPSDGICHKEIMYRLACKVSELRSLQERNYLVMDPWDFIRWRLAIKVQEYLPRPGSTASSFVKSAIVKLCDLDEPDKPNRFADPLMRAAVVLSANLQNRPNLYKSGVQVRQKSVSRVSTSPAAPSGVRKSGRARGRPPGPSRPMATSETRDERRRVNRAKIAAALPQSTYQGVNAWRAKREARNPRD